MSSIYKDESAAGGIQTWFFSTLDMKCFLFVKGKFCTKTKQTCTGWVFETCVTECVAYRYAYHAVEGMISQGEIILAQKDET